jgi:hypothetical protein
MTSFDVCVAFCPRRHRGNRSHLKPSSHTSPIREAARLTSAHSMVPSIFPTITIEGVQYYRCKCLKKWLAALDDFLNWLVREAA